MVHLFYQYALIGNAAGTRTRMLLWVKFSRKMSAVPQVVNFLVNHIKNMRNSADKLVTVCFLLQAVSKWTIPGQEILKGLRSQKWWGRTPGQQFYRLKGEFRHNLTTRVIWSCLSDHKQTLAYRTKPGPSFRLWAWVCLWMHAITLTAKTTQLKV